MLALSQPKKKSMLPIPILEKLEGQIDSRIFKIREKIHVALFPQYLNDIQIGLYNYLNKQINRYHPDLKGILAAYGKLKLHHSTAAMNNEESHIHLDVVSDFWVFRPEVGHTLKGVVTKKSASHISCLVHGVFSVPCHRPIDLEPEIPWFGSKVAIGKTVRFTIRKMDLSQKVPFILGDLIEEECYDEDDPFQSQIVVVDDEQDWATIRSTTQSEILKSEKLDEHDSGIDSNDKKKSKRKRKHESSQMSDDQVISSPSKSAKRMKQESDVMHMEVQQVETDEVVSERKHKKKKKNKDREEDERRELEQSAAETVVVDEKAEKRKRKKEKNRESQPGADETMAVEEAESSFSRREAEHDNTVVKVEENSPKKKKKDKSRDIEDEKPSEDVLEQQRQQLLANILLTTAGKSSPKKKKKKDEKEVEAEEEPGVEAPTKDKKKKKKDKSVDENNVTNIVDTAPSFMVPTSTPTPRPEVVKVENNYDSSRDSLIQGMMAKFLKKDKKKSKSK